HPACRHGILRALRCPGRRGRGAPGTAAERRTTDGHHHRPQGLRGRDHRRTHVRAGPRARRARPWARGGLPLRPHLHAGARDRGIRPRDPGPRGAAVGAPGREADEARMTERVGWVALALAASAVPVLTANTYYLYVVISIGLLTIVTA